MNSPSNSLVDRRSNSLPNLMLTPNLKRSPKGVSQWTEESIWPINQRKRNLTWIRLPQKQDISDSSPGIPNSSNRNIKRTRFLATPTLVLPIQLWNFLRMASNCKAQRVSSNSIIPDQKLLHRWSSLSIVIHQSILRSTSLTLLNQGIRAFCND